MSCTVRAPQIAIAQRVQFIARAILFVMLLAWASWFVPFDDLLDRSGTPLGADFSMFYVAGQVIADGEAQHLYDQVEHQHRLQLLFPGLSENFCLPFRYPPFVAVLLAPLARLPYVAAFAVFLISSVAAWATSLRLLANCLPQRERGTRYAVYWGLAGWPVALETLIGGQASLFAVAICVGTLTLLRKDRPIAAGAMLAMAAYKPNVLVLLAVGLVIRFPRMLLGALPVLSALGCLAYWTAGPAAIYEYVELATQLASSPWDVETPFWKVHGLASWLTLALPQHGRLVTLLCGLLVSVALGMRWRRHGPGSTLTFAQSSAALVVTNTLFNPYTPIYDLVLLAPAVLLGAEDLRGRPKANPLHRGTVQLILATLFFGPHLSQILAKLVGVQLFPLAVLTIAIWYGWRCWSDGRKSDVAPAEPEFNAKCPLRPDLQLPA